MGSVSWGDVTPEENMMNRLQGKIALITGAARGLGLAIARAFVDEGAIAYLTGAEINIDGGILAGSAGDPAPPEGSQM
jgi:hypothetical protein